MTPASKSDTPGNETDLLPGLRRSLELCDQCRAYFEMSARPLSAEHEWAVRVKINAEIARIESKK